MVVIPTGPPLNLSIMAESILLSISSSPCSSTRGASRPILAISTLDDTATFDLGKVTHPAQQVVGNSRRTPAPAGDLHGTFFIYRHIQDTRCPFDDLLQDRSRIIFDPVGDTKPGSKCVPQHATSGGSSNQGKRIQFDLYTLAFGPVSIMISILKSSIA